MSVSSMKKMTVWLLREDADAFVRRVQRLRVVSLVRAEEGDATYRPPSGETAADFAARAARVDAVLPVLAKRSKRRRGIFPQQAMYTAEEYERSGDAARAAKTVREVERVEEELAAARTALAATHTRMEALLPYLDLKLPLGTPPTETTRLYLGSVLPNVRDERLTALADEVGFVFEELSRDKRARFLAVICHKSDEASVLRALGTVGFQTADFTGLSGSVKSLFDAAQAEGMRLQTELETLSGRLEILAENITEVEILSDILHTERVAAESKQQLGETAACVCVTGWCPKREVARVVGALDGFCAAFEFTDPADGEEPPVLLSNNGFARNFEWVLGMYSYPKYGRFDPTFVMSIFYFLIFGLMFADAGYGLLLTLTCFLAVRYLKPREGMKRFLLMFGYCGISCIVWGVLLGAYFGDFPLAFMRYVLKMPEETLPNLALLPAAAANLAVLFDPLANPMAFLVLSLAVGAVHLVAGMAVRAFVLCREGKVFDALFDIGSYWLLFAGIGMIFVDKTVGLFLLLGGVLAILLTQGRAKKGVFGKALGGLGGLYGLINYASDLLSYARILALGLAAGVIAQVVNILATMKGASVIGFLMMVVVFVIGHVLNLVINVLGTFVHTSRLQYIEFFGKFYEDGGEPFKPLTPVDKYSVELDGEALK